jgi:hypothetical protein
MLLREYTPNGECNIFNSPVTLIFCVQGAVFVKLTGRNLLESF